MWPSVQLQGAGQVGCFATIKGHKCGHFERTRATLAPPHCPTGWRNDTRGRAPPRPRRPRLRRPRLRAHGAPVPRSSTPRPLIVTPARGCAAPPCYAPDLASPGARSQSRPLAVAPLWNHPPNRANHRARSPSRRSRCAPHRATPLIWPAPEPARRPAARGRPPIVLRPSSGQPRSPLAVLPLAVASPIVLRPRSGQPPSPRIRSRPRPRPRRESLCACSA
jgi:hypothetical protein